jgi:hypothetical protein
MVDLDLSLLEEKHMFLLVAPMGAMVDEGEM